jgi:hypothetical protein
MSILRTNATRLVEAVHRELVADPDILALHDGKESQIRLTESIVLFTSISCPQTNVAIDESRGRWEYEVGEVMVEMTTIRVIFFWPTGKPLPKLPDGRQLKAVDVMRHISWTIQRGGEDGNPGGGQEDTPLGLLLDPDHPGEYINDRFAGFRWGSFPAGPAGEVTGYFCDLDFEATTDLQGENV